MKSLLVIFLLGISVSAMATYPDYKCNYIVKSYLSEDGTAREDLNKNGVLILKKFSENISQETIDFQGEKHYKLSVVLENNKVSVDFLRSLDNSTSITLNEGSKYIVYGSAETPNVKTFNLDFGGNDGRVTLKCVQINRQ